MKRVRLTMSQALVKFLDNQYIECDGVETNQNSHKMLLFPNQVLDSY